VLARRGGEDFASVRGCSCRGRKGKLGSGVYADVAAAAKRAKNRVRMKLATCRRLVQQSGQSKTGAIGGVGNAVGGAVDGTVEATKAVIKDPAGALKGGIGGTAKFTKAAPKKIASDMELRPDEHD